MTMIGSAIAIGGDPPDKDPTRPPRRGEDIRRHVQRRVPLLDAISRLKLVSEQRKSPMRLRNAFFTQEKQAA